eukprot:9477100-Lingulodinium_polyedra.AAC.2
MPPLNATQTCMQESMVSAFCQGICAFAEHVTVLQTALAKCTARSGIVMYPGVAVTSAMHAPGTRLFHPCVGQVVCST